VIHQPTLHAILNGIAAVFLVAGWRAIRAADVPLEERVARHKCRMLAAFAASTVFLASYLHYHATSDATKFQGEGLWRTVYLLVLVPHVILATVMVPFILVLVHAGLNDRIDRHRKLARFTLPVWLYVSVTGVLVYLMLYQMSFDVGPG
jgi:putative membrane protein